MNIVVSHVFSKYNKGDAALLSVLLGNIERTFPSAHVTILTIDTIAEGETFEGASVKHAFFYDATTRYGNSILKLFYTLFVMASTLLWAFIYRIAKRDLALPGNIARITEVYRDADLIIPVGGGYVRGKPGFRSTLLLILLLHPFVLTRILRKPTMIYSQSVGPFGNKFQELLTGFALRRVDTVVVRENISLQLLKRMGITHNVVRSIDVGFLFSSNTVFDLRKKLGLSREKIVVGFTVRRWLDQKQQAFYEKEIARFADNIIEQYHAAVVFIPQVTAEHHHDDDRQVGAAIYGLMRHKNGAHVLTEHYDHRTIKAIYGNLDYTIGTRFHSVIFSLTSHVPAIAIEYEHKTGGIMHDLGLKKWVIRIEDVTAEKLSALFTNLIAERKSYKEHIEATLPAYVKRADELPGLMKKTYESYVGIFDSLGKRAVILCTLDGYANSVKPAQLKDYLEKNGFHVDLCSTIALSRLGNTKIKRLLPGPTFDHLKLYFLEGIFAVAQAHNGLLKKVVGSFTIGRQIKLRGKILKAMLSGKQYDILICENNFDEAVVLTRIAKTQILDLPSPLAEELFYGGELSLKAFERFKDFEKNVYRAADHIAFHWHMYTQFVKKEKYNGNNFISLEYGTERKTRVAHFSKPPRIAFLGYLGGYWVNLPLLKELSKIYAIDIYGGPKVRGLEANYKGYAPTIDVLADYQFGLITITDDPLRRQSFSSKQIEYYSYGLPVLTPEWREDPVLAAGAIHYRVENFAELIKEYSDEKKWREKSAAALAIAETLTWCNSFRSLDPIMAEIDHREEGHRGGK